MRQGVKKGDGVHLQTLRSEVADLGESFAETLLKKLSLVAERYQLSFILLEQRSPRIRWADHGVTHDSDRLYGGLFPSQDGRGIVSVENLPWSTKGILESVRRKRFW